MVPTPLQAIFVKHNEAQCILGYNLIEDQLLIIHIVFVIGAMFLTLNTLKNLVFDYQLFDVWVLIWSFMQVCTSISNIRI